MGVFHGGRFRAAVFRLKKQSTPASQQKDRSKRGRHKLPGAGVKGEKSLVRLLIPTGQGKNSRTSGSGNVGGTRARLAGRGTSSFNFNKEGKIKRLLHWGGQNGGKDVFQNRQRYTPTTEKIPKVGKNQEKSGRGKTNGRGDKKKVTGEGGGGGRRLLGGRKGEKKSV